MKSDTKITNTKLAKLFQKVASAYEILNENRFKIMAYQRASENIKNLTSNVKDLWEKGNLKEIPGIGKAIYSHLDEIFSTGHARHIDSVLDKIPETVFEMLEIPTIGPKKAYRIVMELGLKNKKTWIKDLKQAISKHKIAELDGFGEKSENVILVGLNSFRKGQIKEKRILLDEAWDIANQMVDHLKSSSYIRRIEVLGSLRRQNPTIGDIDIAVVSSNPEKIIDHFLTYPHQKQIERGPTGASIQLHSGRQVDLRVQDNNKFGAMLQYFTGSKYHNIKLRDMANSQGLSLSEYGIKNTVNGKITYYENEQDFYKALGADYIIPELREDTGEIEAAIHHKLPKVINLNDIKGDLHIHTNYDLSSSHDIGQNPLSFYLEKAIKFKFEYIGLSDHNPAISTLTSNQIVHIMKKRKFDYEQQYYSFIKNIQNKINNPLVPKIFIMLEVDIAADGRLNLPFEAYKYVDAIVVSIHSSFKQDKNTMTKRIIKGLTFHPKVKILGHPTGRLLLNRQGIEANWQDIYQVCRQKGIALEINANPNRLDFPDMMIKDALKYQVKFCINTDAHDVRSMDYMVLGVSQSRRGWAQNIDIVNTKPYKQFRKWLIKS